MGLKNQPPELLDEFAAHAAAVLIERARVPREVAEHLGMLIAERIGRMMGPRRVYLPSGTSNRYPLTWAQRQERDLAVYRAFDGRNMAQIIEATGLSRKHVYNILERVRSDVRSGRLAPPAPLSKAARPAAPQPRPRRRSYRTRAVPEGQGDLFGA